MKKIISILLVGFMISLVIISSVKAQVNEASLAMSSQKSTAAIAINRKEKLQENNNALYTKQSFKEARANVKASRGNFSATKNFNKSYKDAQDVNWINEDNVFYASFNNKDVRTSAVYNKKGYWLYTMSIYNEDKMPVDIKNTVKKAYSNFNIALVQQIQLPDQIFYIVHLKNDNRYMKVAVSNGKLEVYQ